MQVSEFQINSKIGAPLYAAHWGVDQAKAVVALVHGLGEHCRRYDHVAKFLNTNHIAVVAHDQKGHGRTEGKRGHTPSMEAFLDDVDLLIAEAKRLYPGIPLIIYGHSMGGNIVLNYVTSRKPQLSGIITTGAFIQFYERPPAIQLFFGKIIRKIYPSFSQANGLDLTNISTVQAEIEKYKNDPLVHGVVTSATAIDMITTAERLEAYKGELPAPALLMHGAKDRITAAKGSREFTQNISGDVTYKEWEGLYHEIHNEHNRNEVFDFTLNWINNKIL